MGVVKNWYGEIGPLLFVSVVSGFALWATGARRWESLVKICFAAALILFVILLVLT